MLVEGLAAGREEFDNQRRDRAILLLPLLDYRLHPDGVPQFEDAALPVEAPLHGIIDRDDVVRDFRNAIGGVVEGIAEKLAIELPRAVGRLQERSDALADVLNVAGHFERRQLGLLPRAVFKSLKVESQNLAIVAAL